MYAMFVGALTVVLLAVLWSVGAVPACQSTSDSVRIAGVVVLAGCP